MITGDIKNQIDRIWDSFWSGGISNPMEVIEQITYLLFVRRLDDLHTLEENKSARLKKPMERRVFPEGADPRGRAYNDLRWSRLKHFAPAEMHTVVDQHVFPFLRTLGGDDSTYAHHMKDARFTIPTPALLAKVVDLLDRVPMEERDTKGDVYEYMLGKIAAAGQNGQFRTPRHIIRLMVELTAPRPDDVICDPACGTAGFLVAAGEYLRERHPNLLHDAKLREHFHRRMFHGFDFDNTMLRIGSMNMLLHGVENPDIRYRDSLAQDHAGEEEKYSLVLANPPFAGSLDYENTAKDLLQIVKTKKTELLFLALFLRLLKPGGRAAVIVPDGVLFGSSKAHKELRRMLVEDQKLDAVVSLPGGVFKPYAGVSTAILVFTKTNSGSRRCDPTVGDVLISCSGTIGRVASVETTEKFSLVRSAALIRPNRTKVDYKFLEHYLRTPAMKARMLRRANASSQANLFQGQIRELPVYLPPLRLQRAFSDRATCTARLEGREMVALDQLDALFASLQHRAFRGEL